MFVVQNIFTIQKFSKGTTITMQTLSKQRKRLSWRVICHFMSAGFFKNLLVITDPSLSADLSQRVAFACSDRALMIRLCSSETHAISSHFNHFQAGSVDFELVVVKLCVWGTFKSDGYHSATFKGVLYLSEIKR